MKKFICIIIFLYYAFLSMDAQQYARCPQCYGYGTVTTFYGPMYCPTCGGSGVVIVSNNPIFQGASDYKTFVKTKIRCQKDNCSCSGYWGYEHLNGTYEGSCSNSDGHGHPCGHSPKQHGLKSW